MPQKDKFGHVRARRNEKGVVTSFEARVTHPYHKTASGNPLVLTKTFSTEIKAIKWIGLKEDEIAKTGNIAVVNKKFTVAEAYKGWLKHVAIFGDDKQGALRASTLGTYRDHGERFIIRKVDVSKTKGNYGELVNERRAALRNKLKKDVLDIGSIALATLTAVELETWVTEMVAAVGVDLTRRVLRDTKCALAYGAKKLNIPNRWTDVKLGRERSDDGSVEIVIQTDQARAFLRGALQLRDYGFVYEPQTDTSDPTPDQMPKDRVAKGTAGKRAVAWARYATLVYILFRAGVRLGEAMALQWCNIDWAKGRIFIAATVSVSPKGEEVLAPKTARGRRWIALDGETMAVLRSYCNWCESPRSKSDIRQRFRTDDDAFVFGTGEGARWGDKSNFRARGWDVLAAELGLLHPDGGAWASPHDARHWHASFLIESGTPIERVSMRLGHRDSVITARYYIHILGDREAVDRETADAFEAALAKVVNPVQKIGSRVGPDALASLNDTTLRELLKILDQHRQAA